MSNDVVKAIESVIKEVAQLQKIILPTLKLSLAVVDDLGFTSLQVAALIANLEDTLGIDPFEDEDVMITDIRTIGDLCQVYQNCLAKTH